MGISVKTQNSSAVTNTVSAENKVSNTIVNAIVRYIGCSEEEAKKLAQNSKFINGVKTVGFELAPLFVGMNTTQIGELLRSFRDKNKYYLAKEACRNGLSYADLDTVFAKGSSIFSLQAPKKNNNPFAYTSTKEAKVLKTIQNGQMSFAA